MSPQVVAVTENTTAEQINTRMLSDEFKGLPVLDDNGSVVGIVTALDILKVYKEEDEDEKRQET